MKYVKASDWLPIHYKMIYVVTKQSKCPKVCIILDEICYVVKDSGTKEIVPWYDVLEWNYAFSNDRNCASLYLPNPDKQIETTILGLESLEDQVKKLVKKQDRIDSGENILNQIFNGNNESR